MGNPLAGMVARAKTAARRYARVPGALVPGSLAVVARSRAKRAPAKRVARRPPTKKPARRAAAKAPARQPRPAQPAASRPAQPAASRLARPAAPPALSAVPPAQTAAPPAQTAAQQPRQTQRAPAPPALSAASRPAPPAAQQQPQVYVLELEGGFVYVGKAFDVGRRVADHARGGGSAFTRAHKPTGRLLPRLGTLSGSGDGPERDETLRQMLRRGAKNVRGWRYCNGKKHSKRDLLDIERDIRELLDLCRRCGREGHFATGCRMSTDRVGAKISSRGAGRRV